MLTTRSGGNVWSYPNIHGDVAAVANASGVKQGATTVYDPYGNLVSGTQPDNSAGNLDYGWLGQHERPLEHEATLQPVIEMGARQDSPLLGRFLEVNPVEGGCSNAYAYVKGDPIGSSDLEGLASCRSDKQVRANSTMWMRGLEIDPRKRKGYNYNFRLSEEKIAEAAENTHPSISNVSITMNIIRRGKVIGTYNVYSKAGPVALGYVFHTNIWRRSNRKNRWRSGDTMQLNISGVLDPNLATRTLPGGFVGTYECRL